MGHSMQSTGGVVEEIKRLYQSLPQRPSIEEVEAAEGLLCRIEEEENLKLEAITQCSKDPGVPNELFGVLQEMEKRLMSFKSGEDKREAVKLLELEELHKAFDKLIQQAARSVSPSSNGSVKDSVVSARSESPAGTGYKSTFDYSNSSGTVSSVPMSNRASMDDSFITKGKLSIYSDSIARDSKTSRGSLLRSSGIDPLTSSGEEMEKLNLLRLASLIENCAKKGTRELNLRDKLMDEVGWLPESLKKLSLLTMLDLSDNCIAVLPKVIGSLSSLRKLDLHANRLAQLPDSIGELENMFYLDLRGNQLSILPSTFGNLVHLSDLDLSANHLSTLPDAIGNLINLKKLIIETNDLEELPYTIDNCVSLVELRADYNRLKGLPEALGKLNALEVLSLRYNNIRALPSTMASMSQLSELDVSFNELESVHENLCFATKLVKLNLGNNFADLKSLPRSFGNLEMLQELDISNNQIRFLPESFRLLTNLCVLKADQNPLEVPPRHIAQNGAQAVVQYMEEHATRRNFGAQPVKLRRSWSQFCFCYQPD